MRPRSWPEEARILDTLQEKVLGKEQREDRHLVEGGVMFHDAVTPAHLSHLKGACEWQKVRNEFENHFGAALYTPHAIYF
jgi:hypothetical protein